MRETEPIADYIQTKFTSNNKAITTTSTWINCLHISEKDKSCLLSISVAYCHLIVDNIQGGTLKETKESQKMLYMQMPLLACRGSL